MRYKLGFKAFLEDVQNGTMNSDKEVKLEDYKDKVDKYNADKSKFMPILNGKKQDVWEEEANKIIDGNPYLGAQWKIDKMEHSIKDNDAKVKSGDLSKEEMDKIKLQVKEDQAALNKLKQEISKKIRMDLHDIQFM